MSEDDSNVALAKEVVGAGQWQQGQWTGGPIGDEWPACSRRGTTHVGSGWCGPIGSEIENCN